jgi:pimeloyl-ACP methyl ester carboxylesterase
MGAALALLSAADSPGTIARLILLSPSGLPLAKPIHAIALTFLGQIVRRRYPLRELGRSALNTARAPRSAFRLAVEVHDLDLTPELEPLRTHRVPTTVVACAEDALATPEHCRRLAALLDAEYRELHSRDGHIWPVTEPELLRVELALTPAAGR